MPKNQMINRAEIHQEIVDRMHDLYVRKNADYGNSFASLRRKYPNIATLIRLNDKLNRLDTLMCGAEAQVTDESIDDTLLDLANYAVMELVERTVDRLEVED